MKYLLYIIVFFTTFSSQNKFEFFQAQKHETIIVYGSDTCHYCIDTKTYLKERKIEFVYYDIDINLEKQKEMVSKLRNANISLSNLSLPVIDRNGIVFQNSGNFQDFLKKLNSK